MATLQNVYLSSINLGSEDIIAVKAVIDGHFESWHELTQIVRELFLNRLNGAVFSTAVYYNFYNAPQMDVPLSPILGMGDMTVGSFGGSSGFQIETAVTYQPLGNVSQPNSAMCTYQRQSLTYKGKQVCCLWRGSGPSGQGAMMPVIIFVNPDNEIFTFQGMAFPGFNEIFVDYQTDFNPADVLPVIAWDSDLYKGDDFANWDEVYGINNIIDPDPNDDITDDIDNEVPVSTNLDPYDPGGNSGGDTTRGDFDNEGNPQPLQPVPSWVKDGLDTGFFTLYNPTTAELQNLASYLWSNNFDLNALKKLFNNPMDLILNFGVVPCHIESGGVQEVGIGLISTGVYMNKAASRHVYLSMGSQYIKGYSAGYLDYSPYTRADLILPFVGVIPLDIDAITEKTLSIDYNIDILTGACVAGLTANGHAIGEYAGNCMAPLPLTGGDYSTLLAGLIQTAGKVAAGVAGGGGAGAVAGGLSAASSAIVNEGKPMIEKGGAVSSAAGYLGHLKPTLIFSIPKQCKPATQIVEEGYPAFITGRISDVIGYAAVYEIHLSGIHATQEELSEIDSILRGGFYK